MVRRCCALFSLLTACGTNATTAPPLTPDASVIDGSAVLDATPDDATPSDDAVTSPDQGGGDAPDAPDAPDATTTTDAADAAAPACGCSAFSSPVAVGNGPTPLNETSGLAASRKNPGVLYAHNDSGDTARFFAIDEKAQLLGQLNVQGATAIDWEDVAVGPCGDAKTCVFLGDVGDNNENRTDYALYLVDEPALDGKPFATLDVPSKKIPFAYPDGKHNCETVLVHPTTGEVFLVTKPLLAEASVYRFPSPLVAGASVALPRVGGAKGTFGSLVTGGDISPCADRVLLRTYGAVLSYAIGPTQTVGDAFSVAPTNLPAASEAQGEAIAFRLDGRAYFTMSEGTAPGNALSRYACP